MDKKDLRIVFMGTPDFAAWTLRSIIDQGYRVEAVVTQPDKPVGRHGSVLQMPPVKQLAIERNIPVLQPEKMKDPEFASILAKFKANLFVVVAFRMLPESIWKMPEFGTFNVHASLLPQYRGAAPINWAVINGETKTGITTFLLDNKIDTGRMILQKPFDILQKYNAGDVHDGLMRLGAEVCLDTLKIIADNDGFPPTVPQPDTIEGQELRPAPKIFRDTCRIDWSLPTMKIHNFIRGLSPSPGAWTTIILDGRETMLKIYASALYDGHLQDADACSLLVNGKRLFACRKGFQPLEILELQPAGKRRMMASEFVNGMKSQAARLA